MYQTEAHLDSALENRIPHHRSIELGWELNLDNYEEVATLDWSAYDDGVSPFGLAQNGFNTESWSRSARSGDIEGLTLSKPLEVDDNGREWGHRSMMTGDLVFNQETGQAFICAAQGWMRFNA